MATTELLATGTTAANSADIVVAAGQSCTIGIKRALGAHLNVAEGSAELFRKDDTGNYNPTGIGVNHLSANFILDAQGTYRMQRTLSTQAFGLIIDGPA